MAQPQVVPRRSRSPTAPPPYDTSTAYRHAAARRDPAFSSPPVLCLRAAAMNGASHHGSTASCASTINYRVASHDDFWIYTPVLHFEPKRAKIKLDKEKRQVHIGPTTKFKIEPNGSDQINGGAIKLHVRADLERGFEWDPKMDKDNVRAPPSNHRAASNLPRMNSLVS